MADPSSESGDSPAVRLGRQLKRIRLAAGYTTLQSLAKRIGFGEDVIQKAETGNRAPSEAVFPAILDACTTSIDGTIRILTDGERAALTELWEVARLAEARTPEFFEKYATSEQKATFLRLWGLMLIPGPLQTLEYAKAIFLTVGLDEEEATQRAELRTRRRARLTNPPAAQVTALIYEPVLSLQVGTPETMTDQLADLLAVSQQRNVVLQVVPTNAYFAGHDGQFELASGPGIADIVDMVNVEDQVTENPAVVARAVAWFETARGYALNVVDSRALITEASERWKSQLQRR
jgi:transcriptional regulator with XRE-family HTH domain